MPPPVRPASSAASSSSRARVPAVALVVAILIAFVWGLVMFVAGRSSVVPDPTPLDEREQAQAGLLRIDRALDGGDLTLAERLIGEARMPSSPVWTGALALRRQRMAALRAGPVWQFRCLSPDTLHPGHWLAIGYDHQGDALLRSVDAGAHWQEVRRLPRDASLCRVAQTILAVVREPTRLGWLSTDGGGSWQELGWPNPSCTTATDLRYTALDDGRIVIALRTTDWTFFTTKPSESWQPLPPPNGAAPARLIALGALEHDALMLVVSSSTPGRMLLSADTGRTWLEAPAELRALADQDCSVALVGDVLQVIPPVGKPVRFARRDGAFLGFGE